MCNVPCSICTGGKSTRLEGYLQMNISTQSVHRGLLSLLCWFICMLNNSPEGSCLLSIVVSMKCKQGSQLQWFPGLSSSVFKCRSEPHMQPCPRAVTHSYTFFFLSFSFFFFCNAPDRKKKDEFLFTSLHLLHLYTLKMEICAWGGRGNKSLFLTSLLSITK